jgi:HEPN domain-containing protein
MNVPQSNYSVWLAKAENDLLNIENNLSARRLPWDTICFHAQQAAEKLLKGFLVFHGREVIHPRPDRLAVRLRADSAKPRKPPAGLPETHLLRSGLTLS